LNDKLLALEKFYSQAREAIARLPSLTPIAPELTCEQIFSWLKMNLTTASYIATLPEELWKWSAIALPSFSQTISGILLEISLTGLFVALKFSQNEPIYLYPHNSQSPYSAIASNPRQPNPKHCRSHPLHESRSFSGASRPSGNRTAIPHLIA
jgi:hypothetical protein